MDIVKRRPSVIQKQFLQFEKVNKQSSANQEDNYQQEDSVISTHKEDNDCKDNLNKQSSDEDAIKSEGQSTFYKTSQSGRFPNFNLNGFQKTASSRSHYFNFNSQDSQVVTPQNHSPNHLSQQSSINNYFQGIPNPFIHRKLSNPNQKIDFLSSRGNNSQRQQLIKSTSLHHTEGNEDKKKRKQDLLATKSQKLLKEIEQRKLTFTTFGFKAQEKEEDPLLQHTINKMLNSNKTQGSMYVTDLWPDSNVKQFINYSKMGQGKYIMRKIAQQAFKQSTENYHSKPNTLTRKDEESVYYYFKDNSPNDHRQQKQLHSVFQTKNSKYEKMIKQLIPQEKNFELNSNIYIFDPNSCKDLIENIYTQDPKISEMSNHPKDQMKTNNSEQLLSIPKNIIGVHNNNQRKLSFNSEQMSPTQIRKSMINYGERFKFQKIDEKSLFSKKESELKTILQDIIIQKLKQQIDTEDTRIENLFNRKKNQEQKTNLKVNKSIKNPEKIVLTKKINKIFEQISDFQKSKQNEKDKKEIDNLSRQLNYAVFRSVEEALKHQNETDLWSTKYQNQ